MSSSEVAANFGNALVVALVFAIFAFLIVQLEKHKKGAILVMLGSMGICVEMYTSWESAKDGGSLTGYFSKGTNLLKICVIVLSINNGRLQLYPKVAAKTSTGVDEEKSALLGPPSPSPYPKSIAM